jgi:hypothetical protein
MVRAMTSLHFAVVGFLAGSLIGWVMLAAIELGRIRRQLEDIARHLRNRS